MHIELPRNLTLMPPGRAQFLKFIFELRQRWLRNLRFAQLTIPHGVRFDLDALCLFGAELHELVISRPAEVMVMSEEAGGGVLSHLVRAICDARIDKRRRIRVETSDGAKRVFLESGDQVLGEAIANQIDPYVNFVGEEAAARIYDAVVEAMANSLEHAYKSSRFLRASHFDAAHKWWLAGLMDANGAQLSLCDLGVGIPRTFRSEWGIISDPRMRNIMLNAAHTAGIPPNADAMAIFGAWRHTSTSTFAPGRGRGFHQICDIAQVGPGASVTVFSNKGMFAQRFEERDTYLLAEFGESLNGTVTTWKLPFQEVHSD